MPALPKFQLLRPLKASDAVALRGQNPASRFLAGGTDLMPNMRRGLATPDVVIDLGNISELREMREADGTLRIGAGVTLATIANDPRVVARLPALAQAAVCVAGPTHRTMATLGGNLCLDTRCQYYNQSEPWREGIQYCMKLDGDICRVAKKSKRCWAAFSGDVAPALMVLGAQVDILGPTGLRRIPIQSLYRDDGMNWLTLTPDELVVAISVPFDDTLTSAYQKLRTRGSIDFAIAGVAVSLRRDRDAILDLRVACTGVSSAPFLIDGLQELSGKNLDEAARTTIAARIEDACRPMKTTLTDVLYRHDVIPVLTLRLLQGLWERV
jgi:4-hydroxybenzoyl-CoA reductase subunit beta